MEPTILAITLNNSSNSSETYWSKVLCWVLYEHVSCQPHDTLALIRQHGRGPGMSPCEKHIGCRGLSLVLGSLCALPLPSGLALGSPSLSFLLHPLIPALLLSLMWPHFWLWIPGELA